MQRFCGFTFTLESSASNIDTVDIERLIESQLEFEYHHVKINSTSSNKCRIFILEKEPFIDNLKLYKYEKSDYNFIKDQLLMSSSLDFELPLNGYVTIMNSYTSAEPIICGTKLDNNIILCSNFKDKDIQFPFCTNLIYFNSSSMLHRPLMCNAPLDKELCELYVFSTLMSTIYDYDNEIRTGSVDWCLVSRYKQI